MTKALKNPLLRHKGGKWLLAPWIIKYFPKHLAYVEPFGGGASVLLRKEPSSSEVYNDLHGEVCNLFQVLRDHAAAERLKELCALTPFHREELVLASEPAEDSVERARRTIVKSFFGRQPAGVSGSRSLTLRFYRDGKNSVARSWAGWPENIPLFVERLRSVNFECMDALELIPKYDTENTLFYVDPPYVHATRSDILNCRDQYVHELDDAGHEALAEVLKAAQGYMVLSGYPSGLYEELFPGWKMVARKAFSETSERTECLWLSPRTVEALGVEASSAALCSLDKFMSA